MFDLRLETTLDVAAREDLLDRCFGDGRFAKTSERLREGRLPAPGLSLVVTRVGTLVGTIRLWDVEAGPGRPALLLGPLAVEPTLQGAGLGGRLVREALARAGALGHGAVILVGDEPYYRRFGFAVAPVAELTLPSPFDRARFLGLELRPGALSGAAGVVTATGMRVPGHDLVPTAANSGGPARIVARAGRNR